MGRRWGASPCLLYLPRSFPCFCRVIREASWLHLLRGGPEWAVELGARGRGSCVWQPFLPENNTVGFAQPDLHRARKSPASLFPSEAVAPACSCNLLPSRVAVAPFLLPFLEDAEDDSLEADSYAALAEQVETRLDPEGIPFLLLFPSGENLETFQCYRQSSWESKWATFDSKSSSLSSSLPYAATKW